MSKTAESVQTKLRREGAIEELNHLWNIISSWEAYASDAGFNGHAEAYTKCMDLCEDRAKELATKGGL